MKKILILLFIAVLVLMGCNTNQQLNQQANQKSVYQLAVTIGYQGDFAEWLESILKVDETIGRVGIDGRDIELIVEDDFIKWFIVGNESDVFKLLALEDLIINRDLEREVMFQEFDGFLQWKYTTDSKWKNLLDLSILFDPYGDRVLSAYQLYKEYFPDYEASEQQWINDLMNNNLEDSSYAFVIFKTETGRLPYNYEYIQAVNKGDTIELPSVSKVGHELIGWFTENEIQFTDTEVITNTLAVYAKWEVKQYTINFVTNNDELVDSITLDYGTSLELPIPINKGNIFVEWFLDAVLTEKNDYITMPHYDLTLYALWEQGLDMGGYKIVIQTPGHIVHEMDPFHYQYNKPDREARQEAWRWVKNYYNVEIEVQAYPPDVGLPGFMHRINYILNGVSNESAFADFYYLPSENYIKPLVNGDAIYDVTDWYRLYGQDTMAPAFYQSGSYQYKLYSINDQKAGINSVIYYNTNLLAKLNMGKTPGQMFLDNEWTYSAFKEYAITAQQKLNALGENYYAVAGIPTYYWVGMVNAGNVRVANTDTFQMDVLNPIASEAVETLRGIFDAGAMDPKFQIEHVESWNHGNALFTSGQLWFVNISNRWPSDLWGPGDKTQYDYVPFPRPDSLESKDEQGIAIGARTSTMVMAKYRDYSEYPDSVTAENIYRAIMDTFLKTQEYLDEKYDHDTQIRNKAEAYNTSSCSIEAFIFMTNKAYKNIMYDPLVYPYNSITNMASGELAMVIREYILGDIDSYEDSVSMIFPNLQNAFMEAIQ